MQVWRLISFLLLKVGFNSGFNNNGNDNTLLGYKSGYSSNNSINNVFIGSNSALVAPVKIDKGSFVGAGSVITKDSKDNSLAISRTKQINIENWEKKKPLSN